MPTLKSGRRAGQAMEASLALMVTKIGDGVTDKRDLLDETVECALKQAKGFLEADIPPEHPEFARLWAIKASLVATALSTQTKVDELELRRMKTDGFDALMRQVEAVQLERQRRLVLVDQSAPVAAE